MNNHKIAVSICLQCFALCLPCIAQPTVPESAVKGIARTSLDSPKLTQSQISRRKVNNEAVKALGLHILEALPVTENELAIKPRSNEDIAKRCIAVEICAVKSEAPQANDAAIIKKITDSFQAATFFSPEEKAFIKSDKPSKHDVAKYNWQYERVHVLLWALGYLKQLKPANQVCDVPGEAKILKGKTLKDLVANAKPKSMKEIMDQAGLYYRLHWAATELRLHNKQSAAVNEEVVQERHAALNWLIRYENEDWDDITTDT